MQLQDGRMAPVARHRHCCAHKLGRFVEWVTRSRGWRSRGGRKIGYTRSNRCVTSVRCRKPVFRGVRAGHARGRPPILRRWKVRCGAEVFPGVCLSREAGRTHRYFACVFLSVRGSDGDAERLPLQRKPDGLRSREHGERNERHRDAAHGSDDRDRKAAARRRFRSSCRSIDEIAADRCTRQARVTCRRPDRVRASGRMRGRCPCMAHAPGAIVWHAERTSACTFGRRSGQGIHRSRRSPIGILRR